MSKETNSDEDNMCNLIIACCLGSITLLVSHAREDIVNSTIGRVSAIGSRIHSGVPIFKSSPNIWMRALPTLLLLLGLFAAWPGPSSAQTVTYAYDVLGRLVGVVDPNGTAARYTYDAAGNILSITNTNSSRVSIFSFSPANGPQGMGVTIYGDGFSSTPGQNSVAFNGASAVVSSSTLSTLTVSVPVGATTGTIAVTSPTGRATSTNAFVVTAN